MQLVSIVTDILSYANIVINIATILLLGCVGYYFLAKHKTPRWMKKIFALIQQYVLQISFVAVVLAMLGSLFYSEIAGYTPCELCWYQRIFMYPQVFILGMAWWLRHKTIALYSLVLSVIGLVIAAYHYILQIGLVESSSCAVVGYSSACSQRFVMNLGYVTIPMMALTIFAFVAVVSWIYLINKSN